MWQTWSRGGARVCVSDPRVLPVLNAAPPPRGGVREVARSWNGETIRVVAESDDPVPVVELQRLAKLKRFVHDLPASSGVQGGTFIGLDESGGLNLDDPITACVAYVPSDVFVAGCADSKLAVDHKHTTSVAHRLLHHPDVHIGLGVSFPDEALSDMYFAKRVASVRAVIAFIKCVEGGGGVVDPPDLSLVIDGRGMISSWVEGTGRFAGVPATEVPQADKLCYEVAAASNIATYVRRELKRL